VRILSIHTAPLQYSKNFIPADTHPSPYILFVREGDTAFITQLGSSENNYFYVAEDSQAG
jgi:hypothetical protein